jgi:riboflavin kinase/FMN adenylyltransferase
MSDRASNQLNPQAAEVGVPVRTADAVGATERPVNRTITGTVIHGDARGRTLGFPTANVELPHCDEPLPFGVYAGRVDGWPAAVSVGVRPTFGQGLTPLLEAHLLDFTGDLYNHAVQIDLLRFLRPEARFDTLDALVAQIDADVERTREVLSAAGAT